MLSDGKFEYIYKTSIDRVPFAQVDISTKEVTYLHSDLTGSIVATTDSAGVLIGTVDYSPYGEVIGSSLSRFGYAGEWIDEVTDYVYLRARWMDVSTGSFLSEDPLVQMTNNAFDYTEGNPLSQIDPLGLFSLSETTKSILEFGIKTGENTRNIDMSDFSDWVYENSALITISTSGLGVLASKFRVTAPVGIALSSIGTTVAGYAAYRDFKKGEIANGVVNTLGAIPGIGIFVFSGKVMFKTKKAVKATNNGIIKTRKESRNLTKLDRKIVSGLDNSGIGNSFASLVELSSRQLSKGANECK